MEKHNWEKHYYRFGLSRVKYYVIRRESASTGLFSLVNTHLGHIVYAIEHGYIPVIDMKNYPNCYLDDDEIGVINAWDRLFEEPLNVSLEEAYKGKCIILSKGIPISPRPDDDMDYFNNVEGKLDYWRKIAHKYIRVQPNILSEIDDEYSKMVGSKDRVLGVLARGTDYISLKPYIHPVQPDSDLIIEKCREYMREFECNKIFVATEDSNIDRKFRDVFGDAYISNKKEFVEYEEGESFPQISIKRSNDAFLRGKEYLSTIVMLSRSNILVAGRTSGTVAAMYLSDGFEKTYIFDLGRYGTDEDW